MHGSNNVKFANAEQTKQIHQEKETKEKLHKTNAAIWYNRTSRQKQLTQNYISIKVKGKNRQCLKTIQAATQHALKQELKFLCIKKRKFNDLLRMRLYTA